MVDVNVVTIEGIDYIILKDQVINNSRYLLLVNSNDEDDLCIRKIKNVNGEEFVVNLDSDEEFDYVFMEMNKEKATY